MFANKRYNSKMDGVCRTCMSSNKPVRSLFELDTDFIELHVKLYTCFPTFNFDDSDFPTSMCDACISMLQNSYKFRELCIKSTCLFLKKRNINNRDSNVENVENETVGTNTNSDNEPHKLTNNENLTINTCDVGTSTENDTDQQETNSNNLINDNNDNSQIQNSSPELFENSELSNSTNPENLENLENSENSDNLENLENSKNSKNLKNVENTENVDNEKSAGNLKDAEENTKNTKDELNSPNLNNSYIQLSSTDLSENTEIMICSSGTENATSLDSENPSSQTNSIDNDDMALTPILTSQASENLDDSINSFSEKLYMLNDYILLQNNKDTSSSNEENEVIKDETNNSEIIRLNADLDEEIHLQIIQAESQNNSENNLSITIEQNKEKSQNDDEDTTSSDSYNLLTPLENFEENNFIKSSLSDGEDLDLDLDDDIIEIADEEIEIFSQSTKSSEENCSTIEEPNIDQNQNVEILSNQPEKINPILIPIPIAKLLSPIERTASPDDALDDLFNENMTEFNDYKNHNDHNYAKLLLEQENNRKRKASVRLLGLKLKKDSESNLYKSTIIEKEISEISGNDDSPEMPVAKKRCRRKSTAKKELNKTEENPNIDDTEKPIRKPIETRRNTVYDVINELCENAENRKVPKFPETPGINQVTNSESTSNNNNENEKTSKRITKKRMSTVTDIKKQECNIKENIPNESTNEKLTTPLISILKKNQKIKPKTEAETKMKKKKVPISPVKSTISPTTKRRARKSVSKEDVPKSSTSADLNDISSKFYECDLCGEPFTSNDDFEHHLFAHLEAGETSQFMCAYCYKIFASFSGCNRHIGIMHKTETKYSHLCTICDKVFPTKKNLLLHNKVHTDVN